MNIELTQDEKEAVMTDDFNIHDYAEPSKSTRLIPLVAYMFTYLDFLETHQIPTHTFFRFVLTVAQSYRDIPYHNFRHAFNTTQTVFLYLTQSNMRSVLSELDCFALMISALTVDIDHAGLNNTLHTKTDSPVGLLSNATGTTSVNEVHHCNVTFEILNNESTAILQGYTNRTRCLYINE